jgi:hypothetical protein
MRKLPAVLILLLFVSSAHAGESIPAPTRILWAAKEHATWNGAVAEMIISGGVAVIMESGEGPYITLMRHEVPYTTKYIPGPWTAQPYDNVVSAALSTLAVEGRSWILSAPDGSTLLIYRTPATAP